MRQKGFGDQLGNVQNILVIFWEKYSVDTVVSKIILAFQNWLQNPYCLGLEGFQDAYSWWGEGGCHVSGRGQGMVKLEHTKNRQFTLFYLNAV